MTSIRQSWPNHCMGIQRARSLRRPAPGRCSKVAVKTLASTSLERVSSSRILLFSSTILSSTYSMIRMLPPSSRYSAHIRTIIIMYNRIRSSAKVNLLRIICPQAPACSIYQEVDWETRMDSPRIKRRLRQIMERIRGKTPMLLDPNQASNISIPLN